MEHVTTIHRGGPACLADVAERLMKLNRPDTLLVIAMGGVYLGKRRCKDPQHLIRDRDAVSAYFRLPLEMEEVAFDPQWIMAEENRILVANKPAGIPTQGRRDADYHAFYELLKKGTQGYLGLHHRLDQGTSGLMVFSRHRSINKDLAHVFRERKVEKRYFAVVTGNWPFQESQTTIDAAIGVHRTQHGTRQRIDPGGKKATTQVILHTSWEGFHLVEARPKTGRTHQIRVHLSHVGLPLYGDQLYGGKPHGGFFLHCHHLAWPHQGALKAAEFQCRPPTTWFSSFAPCFKTYFEDHWGDPC